jgi:endoglucanase
VGHRRQAPAAAAAVTLAALTVPLTGGTAGAAQEQTGERAEGTEQVVNGSFDQGTSSWWTTGNLKPTVSDGKMCVDVPGGTTNPWDAIVGQNDIELQEGEPYTFSFLGSGSSPWVVRANVQLSVEPWTQELSETPTMNPETKEFVFGFEAKNSWENGQVAFQIGGSPDPWTFCLDDVSLLGGVAPPPYVPTTGPRVRVNQLGYLPIGPKVATVVTEAGEPLSWQVKDSTGAVKRSGTTVPKGVDASSGQNVQTIDFTGFRAKGTGYTLTVDGETSHPFDIRSDLYSELRVDSKRFFYTQRSGTPILGSIAGEEYARSAGHVGVAPNKGDTDVPCVGPQSFYDDWTCDYTLDASGGWYDAGDHGKYVVNGGIAVAQLLGEYERNQVSQQTDKKALRDGTLVLPEKGNDVPDILDEARWELDFLLRMQVPAGKPLAGMVHHKVHDNEWTGLPLDPAADEKLRELHRPSTAATLNLAATAAQGARLLRPYDKDYARTLLDAAKRAYAAAKANPDMLATVADGTGGGSYEDADVEDEFYWAAAELFLTTGERTYRTDVLNSPVHKADVFTDGGYWGNLAPIARMDLARVPNFLPDRDRVKSSVIAGADRLREQQSTQAYGQAYVPGDGSWAWGSNSNMLNNLTVIATAYDLTGKVQYRDSVLAGMDFLLGRNALNISYITGYGTVYSQNQHSRMYANQLSPKSPHPPVGTIAGGPNSSIQDPLAQQKLVGCAPQFCYIDDIQSWATNELAINWNSALSWVASFAADQGSRQ